MNYENIYNEYYIKYYFKIENLIKNFLQKKCNQNKPYQKSSNEVSFYFINVFNKKYNFENSKLTDLRNLFLNRYSEYETNHINEIFTNEIKNSFDKIPSSELPKNYNYFKLIQRIALLEVAKEITRLLSMNMDLLILYFKHNRFDIFEIRVVKNLQLRHYPHFIELNKIDYPDLYIQQNEDFESENVSDDELNTVEKILLIKNLIYTDKWGEYSERKKAKLISMIIGTSQTNIRNTLAKSDAPKSTYSKEMMKSAKKIDSLT